MTNTLDSTTMSTKGHDSPIPDANTQTIYLFAGQPTSKRDMIRNAIQLPIAVANKSTYLSARIERPTGHGTTVSIIISDVHPAALRLYAWWLKSGDAPLFLYDDTGLVAQPQHSLIWRDCFDLIRAHILGQKFSDMDFQRYILSQLSRWLIPQQDPDLELLDYLWESAGEAVDDELLCFVMRHMFQMDPQATALLVGWLKRLVAGRNMMDYIENIADGKRRGGPSADMKAAESEISTVHNDLAKGVNVLDAKDSPLLGVKENAILKFSAPGAKRKRTGRVSSKTEASIPVTSDQRTSNIWEPQLGGADARLSTTPDRNSIRQAPPSLPIQQELQNLPVPLRIHPSITNVAAQADMNRRQKPISRLVQTPSPHPSARKYAARSIKPSQSELHKKVQGYDHPQFKGESQSGFPSRNSVTMPPVSDESLQLLDFWTDPGDRPGPDFFNIPVDVTRPYDTHDRDSHTPTAKQVVQSFRLTRTPTPRRRSTRSWSVASIRSLESEKPAYLKSVLHKPGRSLISRKPVSQAGIDFLGKYADGKMIQRMVSLNSRPAKLESVTNAGKKRDGVDLWDWEVPVRRPGTA